MAIYDIAHWVEQEEAQNRKQFREAIHTILIAISLSKKLHREMIIKGGILLALRYNSTRYTTDIDFSTSNKLKKFNLEAFLSELEKGLILASDQLDYGLDCRIQSYRFKPPSPEASFPTLKLRIGYAYKGDLRNQKRLMANKSIHVVEIDYSFNESSQEIELIELSEGGKLYAYSITDLIGEKFRAILQQKVRNRFRRQDTYDVFYLLKHYPINHLKEKRKILDSLIRKSASRNLDVNRDSISDDEIKERSKKEYHLLNQEIEDDLPDFDEVFDFIKKYYESLPWNEI
jgi:hypothetical protein